MMRVRVGIFSGAAVLTVALSAGGSALAQNTSINPLRTWTMANGQQVEAALLSINGGQVRLEAPDGKLAFAKADMFVEDDRSYIQRMLETGDTDFRRRSMPHLTNIPRPVKVTGGPEFWETPHFRFQCMGRVTPAFVTKCAPVFEGTLEALRKLPLGMDLAPPDGDHFSTHFMDRATFELNMSRLGGGGSAAGVYISGAKKILVPYESLGAEYIGGQVTLRKNNSQPGTLIHEITHQVMHEWLPWLPMWMIEGMAEYVSATPYEDGRFAFSQTLQGMKECLKTDYDPAQTKKGSSYLMVHPHHLIGDGAEVWRGGHLDYQSGMLMVYYLIHLDQGGQGRGMGDYLGVVRYARLDTPSFYGQYAKGSAITEHPLDLSRQLAKKALLGDRDIEALAREILWRYRSAGISIEFVGSPTK